MYPYPVRSPQCLTPCSLNVNLPQCNEAYLQKPSGWIICPVDLAPLPLPLPHLHPALAAETTRVRYDLRKPVQDGIALSTYHQFAFEPAFAQPTEEINIISKAFPWSVHVAVPSGSEVTCGDVLQALYEMLQKPIADSEWGIVVRDESRREVIEKAAKVRRTWDEDACLKRIDWLGETTVFKGLVRNEAFQRKRLLPYTQACKETWVVKFGKP